jgi:uncharacterized protein
VSDKTLIMGEINQDPSMEEILASIKRVIADDGRPAAAPVRARLDQPLIETESAAAPEPEEEDVLELSNPISEDDRLTSENATVAARQSLAALAALRQAEPDARAQTVPGDGPLEAVVREMLRPMLKDWLDQRLPEMVEEMVAREIARITGKNL